MLRRSILLLAAAMPLAAQLSPTQIEALERAAMRHMSAELIPGLSVAVATGEGPMWTAALGFADLENHVPTTPRTVFRLASISKAVTAVAAMTLVEQGRLNLDAPVQDYVRFPRKQWPITTRQLLGHQAGIRHYKGGDFDSTRHFPSVMAALEMFARDPLEHEPGTKYLYSTYGFNLAGAVVEQVAGMPYEEWVRERILTPAAVYSIQQDGVYRVIPHRARGYRLGKTGILENCSLADTSNKLPGGGWVANAADLVRFARALMEGTILKQASLDEMWRPGFLRDGKPTHYGLGWNVQNENGVFVVQHSGGQQGASTHLLLVPATRTAIAVLANLEGGKAIDLAREFARIVAETK